MSVVKRMLMVAIATTSVAFSTNAQSKPSQNSVLNELSKSAFLTEGQPTLAPMGHVLFCVNNPSECMNPDDSRQSDSLSFRDLGTIALINHQVNRSIFPFEDSKATAFADQWTLSPKMGDCEDYALTKRHRLIAAGYPARSLRLAVSLTPNRVGHAVLIVTTETGDYVLDNLTSSILPANAAKLKWISIQSADDPHFWREIETAPDDEDLTS